MLLVSGRFAVSQTIIPEAQEHFLTPSAHRDTHIFGGLGLRDFGARSQALDQRHDELLQKYPDQWVALTSNWTLVAADTIEELAQSLDKKGLRRNDVAYRFMATNRRPMILLKKVARLVAVDDEIDRLRFAVDLA